MSNPSIGQARVIEIDSMTAGIVVPEARGYRFFSSQRSFDALDGHVFRSIGHATAAARDRLRSNRSSHVALPSSIEQAGAPSDLLLGVQDPFLFPARQGNFV